jgi:hypothetical protein
VEKCPSCNQDQPIKVTVHMHPDVIEALKWIAKAKGITVGQALARTVSHYQWSLKERVQGHRLHVERRGRFYELLDF